MAEDGEQLSFRPTARMASMLGEHLIRDNTTGILELIKNSYDADASCVRVELLNLSAPAETKVIVHDDGRGMDESTLRGPWSEPAHVGKQDAKNRLQRTARGRLPLGEKGVGRFAAQKLGRHLFMATKPEGSDAEHHVRIDWDDFDASGKYMDEVEFPLEKKSSPVVFAGESHGTRIEITGAKTSWKKSDVNKLRTGLIRLLSPSGNIGDFSVVLGCPEYPELENLGKDNVLDRFQFRIDCSIDCKGFASYSYQHRKHDGAVDEQEEEINLWSDASDQWEHRDPACGPLRIVISAWLREAASLKAYQLTGKELDILSGISIYRDSFRIIPYGDPGDDWLKLDPRRTNSPGQKYGNNQVVGRVEISQDKNARLIDKTSREGLQENQAFDDMRLLVLATMTKLEVGSVEHRRQKKKPKDTVKDLGKKVTELQCAVEKLQSGRPAGPARPLGQNEDGEDSKDHDAAEAVSVPRETLDDLVKKTSEIGSSAKRMAAEPSGTESGKDRALLHLAGVGMAAERFSHEFDRMVVAMSKNLEAIERKHPFYSAVKALRLNFDVLKNEVDKIGAIMYVKKPLGELQTGVRDTVSQVLGFNEACIQKNKIRIDHPTDDFAANISMASLSQVLDNIVSNACYWLGKETQADDRRLRIAVYPDDRTVIISNNGPFMAPNIKKRLCREPFVTAKPDGRGLGLYISNEIMKNSGKLELLPEDDQRNAFGRVSFALSFPEQATGGQSS